MKKLKSLVLKTRTQGSMKRVFKTTWRGVPVILARVKRFKYYSFINNLRSLQPSVFVTQLIGACEDPAWPEGPE